MKQAAILSLLLTIEAAFSFAAPSEPGFMNRYIPAVHGRGNR
jgi:hypothetical protein